MGDEESERVTVPVKPGNAVHADPVEGKARRHYGTVWRNDDRDTVLDKHLPAI